MPMYRVRVERRDVLVYDIKADHPDQIRIRFDDDPTFLDGGDAGTLIHEGHGDPEITTIQEVQER